MPSRSETMGLAVLALLLLVYLLARYFTAFPWGAR